MLFHEWNSVGWHVAATCHLRKLFIFLCICGGTYIYVPIYVHTIKYMIYLNKVLNLVVLGISLCRRTSSFCLMGPGCPLLLGLSARRPRRCAATLPPLLERTFPGSIFFSAFGAAAAVWLEGLRWDRLFWAHLTRKFH